MDDTMKNFKKTFNYLKYLHVKWIHHEGNSFPLVPAWFLKLDSEESISKGGCEHNGKMLLSCEPCGYQLSLFLRKCLSILFS